ncbi:hypothetical protein LZ31DRAFT_551537 [Colletotrichum somersetense]|nr:hypothetical protein LZ31DRAFT_551537 [Colletotrichum somersetense]
MSSRDEIPVRGSIRQLDPESWVIGGCILLSRTTSSNPSRTAWSDGKGAYFTVSYSQGLLPPGALPPTGGPIKLVHDAGDASAVWSIGDAFLKVHILDPTDIDITREHTTLEYLHEPTRPELIIVDLARNRTDKESSIGIIDWEMAGFVPRAWIRTKFCICGAMNLDFPGHTDEDGMSERVEWRRRVQRKLEEEGSRDISSACMERLHLLST